MALRGGINNSMLSNSKINMSIQIHHYIILLLQVEIIATIECKNYLKNFQKFQ